MSRKINDPRKVMIFGMSGGGGKVSALQAMPTATGLFHRAVIQSGPGLRMATRERATATAEKVVAALGLDKSRRHELHTLPVQKIIDAQGIAQSSAGSRVSFSPVVDGDALPRHPFDPDAPEMSADCH
jgi:para-nitrobenzyl esterase